MHSNPKTHTRAAKLSSLLAAVTPIATAAVILSGFMAHAQVYVESRAGGKNYAAYSDSGAGFPNSWADSGAKSTADGVTAGIGSRYNTAHTTGPGGATTWFQVSPTLPNAGGTYDVHVTMTSASGALSATSTITQTDCTGLPETTTAFSSPGNEWNYVGRMTLNEGITVPTIRFDETANENRFYADAVRFTPVQDCSDIPEINVTGPLSTNVNEVIVTGVTNATKITVYQNSGSGMAQIGELTSPGIVDGNNTVPVSGLVKGAIVMATQTVGGEEGCVLNAGKIVGGGANPRLHVAFSIRETDDSGPIGETGSTSNPNMHHLGATGLATYAPTNGVVISPSTEWQTVTLQRGPDYTNPTNPCVKWNSGSGPALGSTNEMSTPWGVFDAISLALNDPADTGPYDIYIDTLQNGSTVIEDFESAAVDTQNYTFWRPGFSLTTEGNLLKAPDISIVTDATAFSGTKSLRLRFQWNGLEPFRWIRLVTSAPPNGLSNPQVDLNEPISVRILLLPVGATPQPPITSPVLAHSVSGDQITFSWTGTFALQFASSVTGPWTTIEGAVTGHQVSTTEAARFYRLSN